VPSRHRGWRDLQEFRQTANRHDEQTGKVFRLSPFDARDNLLFSLRRVSRYILQGDHASNDKTLPIT
jgi:hypothetical protein